MPTTCSVFIATSLDGYIARTDGGLDWLEDSGDSEAPGNARGSDRLDDRSDATEDYGYGAFMASVGAIAMGRATYETVLAFDAWPYGDTPVWVLTSQPDQLPIPGGLGARVEPMHMAPADVRAEAERRGITRVYVDGGRTIQRFVADGCIDDITLTRIPVLIGKGIPLFGEAYADVRLRHIRTRTWPNGYVQSTYRFD